MNQHEISEALDAAAYRVLESREYRGLNVLDASKKEAGRACNAELHYSLIYSRCMYLSDNGGGMERAERNFGC